jgi:hypothetical protein
MSVNFVLDIGITLATVVGIVDAAILVWVALFRLERIEQALGNSKLSVDTKRQWRNAGLVGRQYRLAMAAGVLLFTTLYANRGLADPDDVRRMPISLKCWAMIPAVTGSVVLLVQFVLLVLSGRISLPALMQ